MLLLVEEVGCAERLIVEDRGAQLECAVFTNLKRASRLLERHLEVRRLLGWLCERAKMLWSWAWWPLGLLGWRRYQWWRVPVIGDRVAVQALAELLGCTTAGREVLPQGPLGGWLLLALLCPFPESIRPQVPYSVPVYFCRTGLKGALQ